LRFGTSIAFKGQPSVLSRSFACEAPPTATHIRKGDCNGPVIRIVDGLFGLRNNFRVHAVPTTNFVLHWITGRTEQHRYDESLKSIDLVTADAYEPVLPLSVVIHIDYQKAPSVVQRFADIRRLLTQPAVSADYA